MGSLRDGEWPARRFQVEQSLFQRQSAAEAAEAAHRDDAVARDDDGEGIACQGLARGPGPRGSAGLFGDPPVGPGLTIRYRGQNVPHGPLKGRTAFQVQDFGGEPDRFAAQVVFDAATEAQIPQVVIDGLLWASQEEMKGISGRRLGEDQPLQTTVRTQYSYPACRGGEDSIRAARHCGPGNDKIRSPLAY